MIVSERISKLYGICNPFLRNDGILRGSSDYPLNVSCFTTSSLWGFQVTHKTGKKHPC